jgi:predicted PurR-regulated permease PerM
MASHRPRWSSQTKLVISLLLLSFILYLISRFSIVIPPFILAVILAYILTPVVNFLNKKLHFPRILAILVLYIMILALASTLPVIFVPLLASQFSGLNLDLQKVIDEIQQLAGNQYSFAGQVIDFSNIFDQLIQALQRIVEPIISQTLNVAMDIISSIIWVIFILVVSIYLIKDGEKLRQWFENLVPETYRHDFIHLRREINTIWSSFFRGQLLLGLVVAAIFTGLGFILGIPFALGMGLLAGLLEFLPSIGHGIWLFIASLISLYFGSTWIPIPNWVFAIIIIGLHLVFQQFDLNYLIPRIIGRSVHLPPLVVILGIVSGAVLAGVMGIPLAAPTIASARVIGRYIYANLFDTDPFSTPATQPTVPPNPTWWKPQRTTEKKK